MRNYVVILLALLAFSIKANACEFSWFHYGASDVQGLIDNNIGSHIPDKFCKYAAKYEIVVQSSSASHGAQCIGYAFTSLRRKGTKIQQNTTSTDVEYNPNCNARDGQQRLEAAAALNAVDIFMNSLDGYRVIEK
jgi:hypothetical protein